MVKKTRLYSSNIKKYIKTDLGIIIYQEQVMQIAQTLAGFTAGEAEHPQAEQWVKKRKQNWINKKKDLLMVLLKKAFKKKLQILFLPK